MTQELLPKKKDGRWRSSLKHGHTRGLTYSPTYQSWQSMLTRCKYLDRENSKNHAGRGITVCERWKSFENFLADMGERPAGRTLDRFPNNDGNYEPGNCRWATSLEQARNRRTVRLTFEKARAIAVRMLRGQKAAVVAADFGISPNLPREILKGRTWKDALAAAKTEIGND